MMKWETKQSGFLKWKINKKGRNCLTASPSCFVENYPVNQRCAIQPISTLQFLGNVLTATVSRAGGSLSK